MVRALLAGVLVLRGELDAADAEIEAGGLTGQIPEVFVFSIVLAARGQLRFEQGRLEEAAADLLELDRLSKGWGGDRGARAAGAHLRGTRAGRDRRARAGTREGDRGARARAALGRPTLARERAADGGDDDGRR